MSRADELKAKLDLLEAERMVITVELRTELLRAAQELLPLAISQAKPTAATKKNPTGRPGSPALLRLITRLAMRPLEIDRKQTRKS